MNDHSKQVIVVGFDLSKQSELALEQAIELAQRPGGCDLHVIAVLDNRSGMPGLSDRKPDFAAAERAQDALRTIVDRKLFEASTLPINLFLHARIGAPAIEIARLAGEAEADLIVVGTHGRHGVRRWMLGSVAEHVVRDAPCPVLVARPRPDHEAAAHDDRWAPEPACPQCVEVRRETSGAVWWCEEHGRHHLRPHRYSYSSDIAPTRPGYAPIL